jgi:hypothetical protein
VAHVIGGWDKTHGSVVVVVAFSAAAQEEIDRDPAVKARRPLFEGRASAGCHAGLGEIVGVFDLERMQFVRLSFPGVPTCCLDASVCASDLLCVCRSRTEIDGDTTNLPRTLCIPSESWNGVPLRKDD